jgi:hypothetical protein
MIGVLDLIVLVADADTEFTLRTLIERRSAALNIRPLRFDRRQADIIRHLNRDAGTYSAGHEILQTYRGKARHVLVVLDHAGSGQEARPPEDVQDDIERRLLERGWEDPVAVVIRPELETWVWCGSPHIASVLNISDEELQRVLARFPLDEKGKPSQPKEALIAALRQGRKAHSSSIFRELAERVSLQRSERAFDRLRAALQRWFPPEPTL